MKNIGVYIHIPFCASKCPYCDFYSMRGNEEKKDIYLEAMLKEIKSYKNFSADTIYLGGGTPSVFGNKRLEKLISAAKENFSFSGGEITVEINPSSCDESLISSLKNAGVNRISMGLQSANEDERKVLGRHSDLAKITEAINVCKKNKLENISLDIMLGVPNQTSESLQKTLDFTANADIKHVSAYILKIEEDTLFYRRQNILNLPDEDSVCDFYEKTCEYLENHGFVQYEISNFAKDGFESRHNTKYWECEEYIGIGAAAHSYICGKRFYHTRNFEEYIKNPLTVVNDGEGGSFSEFVMLKMRLAKGLSHTEVLQKFSHKIPDEMIEKSQKFIQHNLMSFDGETLKITKKGFLLSNTILSEII